jgi:GT2 family glycosyltransferase
VIPYIGESRKNFISVIPTDLRDAWALCEQMALVEPFEAGFADVESPDVSIIVPIYNQLACTLRCLKSIASNGGNLSYEVLLIDDASDLSVFLFLSGIKGLRLLRNFFNLGFVLGCNRGASIARGRYLLFLNNDTEVTPGWLDSLYSVFRYRPEAGLVGAKLLNTDGSLQEAGGIVWQDGSAWNYGRGQNPTSPAFDYLRETDYCSGACIMIEAALWHRLGGFDEAFAPAYYEDTDLAFRVRQAGRKVFYQPMSTVIHHEGKSNGIDSTSGLKAYQVRNRKVFLSKWQRQLASTHFANGTEVFRARERSFAKKTILIIDHYVPHPDRDAGSRSVMSYIALFLKRGLVVKFIGDNHFPHQPYTQRLQEMGVEVLVGAEFATGYEEWFRENGRYIDYIFLCRAHTSRRWLPVIGRNTRATILFYGVDLISRTLDRAARDLNDESFRRKACEYAEFEKVMFSQSDWIFYPSDAEVSSLKIRMPNKKIARIPLLVYETPDRGVAKWVDRRGLLFVGGFGHDPNCDAVKWFVSEVWPRIRAHIPSIIFTIIGSRPTEEILALGGNGVQIVADATDAELLEQYGRHRIAIVPLRYGGGIKGKVLEAFYHGGTGCWY